MHLRAAWNAAKTAQCADCFSIATVNYGAKQRFRLRRSSKRCFDEIYVIINIKKENRMNHFCLVSSVRPFIIQHIYKGNLLFQRIADLPDRSWAGLDEGSANLRGCSHPVRWTGFIYAAQRQGGFYFSINFCLRSCGGKNSYIGRYFHTLSEGNL